MTTNVCDSKNGIVASDTRWSRKINDWLVYVDGTGYDKIAYDSKFVFVFAGEIDKISAWKDWVQLGRSYARPQCKGVSVIVSLIGSGERFFVSHDELPETRDGSALFATYAGTGWEHAKESWEKCNCAKQATLDAIDGDDFSGGYVVYYNCKSKENNVLTKTILADVREIAKTKGFIMKMNRKEAAIPIQEAANDQNNPELKAIAAVVMSGGMSFSAPFDGIESEWPQSKVDEFDQLMSQH